jgi:hypothetical protein
MENKTIYCGSGKTQSGKYGEFFKVSICLSDLPKEFITEAKNGKKYINLTINRKKEADQYGKDLSVQIDTWKPEAKQEPAPIKAQASISQFDEDGQLPF